jgi:ribosomal protein L40E
MDILTLAGLPGWLAPLLLVLGVIITLGYIWLVKSIKTEKCVHCGTRNPVEAINCQHCSESTLQKPLNPKALLLVLAFLMGLSAMLLMLFEAQSYKEPPIDKLLVGTVAIILFIMDSVLMFWENNRRVRLKQETTILRKGFYGGYCGGCGREILGGITACPYCGVAVNIEKPNWTSNLKTEEGKPQTVDLKIVCPKCKVENPSSTRKCQVCNTDLLTFKPVWQRLLFFPVSLLLSAGAIWLAYMTFVNSHLKEVLSFLDFGPIALGLFALVMPFYGLYLTFGKGSFHGLFTERADRHKVKFAWQALSDYSHALALAPAQQHRNILTKRLAIFQSLGLSDNATRDELAITYAREKNPEGGVGLFLGEKFFGNAAGGDSFTQGFMMGMARAARKDREKMFRDGRVIALGYCPTCKEILKLDEKLRCPDASQVGAKHHFGKPKYIQFVVPADFDAGRGHLSKVMALAKKGGIRRVWTVAVVIVTLIVLYYFLRK